VLKLITYEYNVDTNFYSSGDNHSAVIIFCFFTYRGRKDRKALYFADNNKLEALWSVIPVILAGLILYGLYAWTNIMFIDEEDDAIVVELYGQQFYWALEFQVKIMF
jgi:cytochrome c oxidase subunit 2